MKLQDLMNACPNMTVIHVGEKTEVLKNSDRSDEKCSENTEKTHTKS